MKLNNPFFFFVEVLSDVSLGKSSQSILIHFSTSHYQCG